MKRMVSILTVVVFGVGIIAGLGSVRNNDSCCPAPNIGQEKASNNDDAFDERHDTFEIEDLAGNNDDAFDERHDTFEIEDLAGNNDDAFDERHDTFEIEDLA